MIVTRFVALIALLRSAAHAQITYLPAYPFNGTSAVDRFGFSVSGAGDVNNDGIPDFIVGAELADITAVLYYFNSACP